MRRVDDEVLEAVGALRNVIGWPASVNGKKAKKNQQKCIIQRVLNGSFLFSIFYALILRSEREFRAELANRGRAGGELNF